MPERAKNDKSEEPLISRLEKMRKDREDDSYQPGMPPLERAEYLIGYFFEIGPTGPGSAQISNVELNAWQGLTGIELRPWEARFIRSLSRDYLGESFRATRRDCPAPWKGDGDADYAVVSESLKKTLRGLASL